MPGELSFSKTILSEENHLEGNKNQPTCSSKPGLFDLFKNLILKLPICFLSLCVQFLISPVSLPVYCCCCLANISIPGIGVVVPEFRPFFYVNVADISALENELSYVACKFELRTIFFRLKNNSAC